MPTLFDKIWDKHLVKKIDDETNVLFIDQHLIHEVTSPVAFLGLKNRQIPVLFPERTLATPDHNVPTIQQNLPIKDQQSASQVEQLRENCKTYGIELHDLMTEHHGIVHVIGPEMGVTQPGMTIVCGDSHTATHGAFGCIAFGIGTSEVEMVLATQCLMQSRPKTMRININGALDQHVTPKDVILYIINQIGVSGGTGYFVEYAGDTIRQMSMEGRMTICNMSIEMGARGGLVAPDETTFEYLKGRPFAPKGNEWEKAIQEWRKLHSDTDATFDKEISIDATKIKPMITYGTHPGMSIPIDANVPQPQSASDKKALAYMKIDADKSLLGQTVDYVFLGSCTNGRIEDLRLFTQYVAGKQKHPDVTAWIVPGSKHVEELAHEEGLTQILESAGFSLRQPGCSACLAMNDDKIPAGKLSISTSNRNFEGRQGPESRTMLAGPILAALAAVNGCITAP